MKKILVTGAAGYIGGQTALQLLDSGYDVIGLDLRPLPAHLEGRFEFVQTDFASHRSLDLIANSNLSAIIHCAGTSLVGPSNANPREYWHNNSAKTLALLDTLLFMDNRPRVVFSSSAAVYGDPIMTPCFEVDPLSPISVYGQSKLMIEWFLSAYAKAYGLDFVSFRYFNVAGADPQGRHGQDAGATHIVARLLESVRDNLEFTCFGNDYSTPDGTCLRDYIHVHDVARAHVLAVEQKVPCGVYNLGTNQPTSNKEVINIVAQVTGTDPNVVYGSRRDGDPEKLSADSTLFNRHGEWSTVYTLQDMVKHAWDWYCRNDLLPTK